jgi:hypothetical protein
MWVVIGGVKGSQEERKKREEKQINEKGSWGKLKLPSVTQEASLENSNERAETAPFSFFSFFPLLIPPPPPNPFILPKET